MDLNLGQNLTIWPILKFDQDYEVLDKLGEGKFGEVFKVRDVHSPKASVYAAKFLHCDKAAIKLRIRDEIDLLHSFDHPHVLRLIGAFEDTDNFIQVLEYLSGGQLFERIIQNETDFLEDDIAGLMRQICEGCRYLSSQNVVHLDIKPENIVCIHPDSFQIKIIDFGFARRLANPDEEVRATEGTPDFVSPEVIEYEPVTLTTDMWSVGVLCYVLLSGLSPFQGKSQEKLLVISPSLRMSASEALAHPWLTAEPKQIYVATTTYITRTNSRKTSYDRSRLKMFITAKSRWTKCANVMLAVNTLKELSE
eukprot:TCALIF_10491-PA protein Name:"Similar to MYLK Myosin light chain kinase, smooth muscle (Bos taurus)" AED:0.13 eAED:0.13 QI:248/0.75/0.8/1/0.75/0.6/5/0/307